jgi:hypothetical protein
LAWQLQKGRKIIQPIIINKLAAFLATCLLEVKTFLAAMQLMQLAKLKLAVWARRSIMFLDEWPQNIFHGYQQQKA